MKKKLIAGMTSAAVIASLSAPAFAANFQDVQGTKFESSAALLKALGVVNGDVNGKFNPNATITRAEFAKIAVLLAGYQDAANAYGTSTTPFSSDVKAGHWAAGYIQIAKDTGLVNGYDAWNFGPSDNVKYEEVIAVLQRILGYNDNLPGAWPTDYVTNGTQIGLAKDTSFRLGTAATRGDVALMAQAALSAYTVNYSKDLGTFEFAKDAQNNSVSLLGKGFSSNVKTLILTETEKTAGGATVDTGKIRLLDVANSVYGADAEYTLDADATFAGNVDALVGHQVKVVFGADNKVLYVADGSNAVVTGKLSSTSDLTSTTVKLKGESTPTTFGSAVVFYYNGQKMNTATDFANKVNSAGSGIGAVDVTLVKNSTGGIIAAFADNWDVSSALVDSVQVGTTSTTLYYKSFVTPTSSSVVGVNVPSTTLVTKNGQSVAASSLVKGDVVYINKLIGSNDATVVAAFNTTVQGKVTSVSKAATGDADHKITINGVEYVVDKNMVNVDLYTSGQEVKLFVDGKNKVKNVQIVSGSTQEVVGYVQNVTPHLLKANADGTYAEYARYTIFTVDGQVVTKDQPYADSQTNPLYKDGFYDVTFDSDGKYVTKDVYKDTSTAAAATIDKTNKTITVGGSVFQVTSSTVIVDASKKDANGNVTGALTTLDNLYNTAQLSVVSEANGVTAKYVVAKTTGVASSAALPSVNGVLVNKFTTTDASGNNVYTVSLNVKGAVQNYNLKDSTAYTNAGTTVGHLVYLADSAQDGGTYEVADEVYGSPYTVSSFTYDDVSSMVYDVNDAYIIDANTTVYIVKTTDGSNALSFGNYYDVKQQAAGSVQISKGANYGTITVGGGAGARNAFHADAIYIER